MSHPEPPPYPGDDQGLPSYGSIPPPPSEGSGALPPPPPPPPPGGTPPGWSPAGPVGPVQNQKALAALILGLISIPAMFCCCIGFATGIASVVLGFLGRKDIRASGGLQTGDGMALAGIILGIVAILGSTLVGLLGIAVNLAEFNPDSFAP